MEIVSDVNGDNLNGSESSSQVYQFQLMPLDLQKIYQEILHDATVNNVFEAFSEYIVENIEPIGWKGLWVPNADEFDQNTDNGSFIVKVTNVYENTLEAKVSILSKVGDMKESSELIQQERTVPLQELFVISSDDDQNMFERTAFLIEIVRFFYDHIWRPWDDLDEDHQDENFLTNRMEPRLNLIFDIKNKVLSEQLINRFEMILSEATSLRKKMDRLKKTAIEKKVNNQTISDDGFNEDSSINSETISEVEALEFMRLKLKLEVCQREMKIIEDPYFRTYFDKIVPQRLEDLSEIKNNSIHLVSPDNFDLKRLSRTIESVHRLLIDDEKANWSIKLHHSLQNALNFSKSGDSIYLTPGIYTQSLCWIENDLEIHGIGDGVVELVSNPSCGDIFLLVNVSKCLKLSNLTIKANHLLDQLIVIKSGNLVLKNCLVDCNHQTLKEQPILQLKDAQLTLIDSKIVGQLGEAKKIC